VLELSPPEMVACAAEAGFSHVGIRLIAATTIERQHDLAGDTPMVRDIERRLAETGLKVLDAEIFRLTPDTRVDDFESAIATAARLGAAHLLVAGNDPDEQRLTDRFGAFCDVAAPYELTANLEFMPWTDAKDLAQGARIVDSAARPNGGVLIDAFHFNRSRSRIDDIRIVPPERFKFVQVCDAPAAIPPTLDAILAEARTERRFPGEGGIDLVALLRALPRDLPLSVEVPMRTLAQTVGAVERARGARVATEAVLARAQRAA
jgi:sugar phosphate isomerase/epimerase